MIRSLFLAAGLVLAASSASAQTLQCGRVNLNGQVDYHRLNRFDLDQARQIATTDTGAQWRLITEPGRYLLDRLVDTGSVLIAIDRGTGRAAMVITGKDGQTQPPISMFCMRGAGL